MRTIRKSTLADMGSMMQLFAHSKTIMRGNGNLLQWAGNYPDEAQVREDMARGGSFVMEEEGAIVGTFAFFPGKDPTYASIEGAWIDDEAPYGTIHRLACAPGCHNIARDCFDWCERLTPTLRVDTHADNGIMLHIVERLGFEFCGIIHIADGTPRKAFQQLRPQILCEELVDWVERVMIPRYADFDSAHQEDHVRKVIEESLRMGRLHGLNANMCFAIAALHDIGLSEGRERHHLASGEFVRNCGDLRRWFSEKQIALMAEAVEDHRASAEHDPRSIYGCIVAEADRDIEKMRIVRRTIQYGLSHYPTLDKEGHWQRTLEHLHEKYAEGGYLKLYVAESENARRLRELRMLIADEGELRSLFEELYAAEGGR